MRIIKLRHSTARHIVLRMIPFSWTILALLMSLVGIYPEARAFAADSPPVTATTVLPVKINAGDEAGAVTLEADQALYNAVKDLGFSFVSRSEAQQAVDYTNGVWPPPVSALGTLITGTTDYLLTGSLTKMGTVVSIDMVVIDVLAPDQIKYYFDEGKASDLATIFARLTKNVQSFTNRATRVASIAISGNKKIESGAIIHKVTLKAGDQYQSASLRQAIKDIYAMGYFDNILVHSSDTAEGKALIFEVTEKPVVGQISIDGEDELKEEKIREVITVTVNSIISTQDVQRSAEAIKQLYKDEGYYNTTVVSDTKVAKTGKVDVSFTIKEGPKVYIKELTVTGNTAFKSKALVKILQTSKKGWFSWFTDSGILKRDLLAQDADRLVAFYNNNGFVDAKVGEPEVTQKDEWLFINFNIAEGDRYKVGTVDLSGDLIEGKSDLMGLTQIIKEPYFSRKTLREDILRITDRYSEKGYAFAEVIPSTAKDDANKRVNIVLNINKKELVHINRIVIKGNSRTRDKVIRREMQVKESGLFNSVALKKSQEKLNRLEYFEAVEITPVPTMDESLMDLQVDVKEKATGNFSIGAGYSSVDSFMFMSEVSQNNFLGKGQRVSLKANISGVSNQYSFNFTEPHLADSNLLFGFDVFNWMREYDDFTKDSQGVGLRFGYPLWEKWHMSTGYTFEDSTLSDVKDTASKIIKDSMNINVTSSVGLGFARDSRDKFTDPSTGSLNTINSKYAGGVLGGDAEFTKFEGSSSWFFRLPWETTFHYKLAAGYAFANSTDKLPVFEKFYLGGMNTIRGFKSSNISPRDPPVTGEKIGGGKMWYSNTEWIFPLVKDAGLKGVVFFDCGNVYDEHGNWDFGVIKKSVGGGFRWLSPMGPLRLEWGYNLDPTEYEVQSNWDFSLGGSF
ncbi:MAG: outer membrane protein assembly factor BamA [Proteobacteria bacterium]|nr:outer membrane protein assembly factor BamA [Pseudomonadota bacterium]MDP2105545.1 outer membrane protein assembly factor BamA [Desulfobulbaceae bacterium]